MKRSYGINNGYDKTDFGNLNGYLTGNSEKSKFIPEMKFSVLVTHWE